MNLIFLALTALLILFNLAGLGLLLHRLTPHYALAKPVAVLGLCLLLYFLEHFVGLGRLHGLWPLTTLLAAAACWRWRAVLRRAWRAELAFGLGFAYAFAWRFLFPDITPSSEHLTDLYFIVNYLPGERLPPVDHWLPPYRFDFYYAWQHYAAALLGRLFGLDSGTTYNFAFCVMVGLIIGTAWFAIGQFAARPAGRLLVLFAFVLGGTGVSPLVHGLFDDGPASAAPDAPPPAIDLNLWRSTRFIGSSDAGINTAFGQALLPAAEPAASGSPRLDLPLESFSYLIFLGDYHPPLAGFLLLVVALACVGILERQPADRFAQGVLAASVPLTLIANAWVFPLQATLLLGWLALRLQRRQAPDWAVLAAAGLLAALLIHPALAGLAAHALSPGFAPVAAGEHTPWRHFLLVHWPLLALLLLSLGQRAHRRLALTLVAVWGGLLLLSETVYVDDIYGGQFNRFNSVLKWWGWIYAGALLTLGAINLGGDSRLARYGSAVVMLLVGAYSLDTARAWRWLPKTASSQFHGHAWLTAAPGQRDLLDYLAAAPPGIVLERQDQGSYGRSSALALFAGQPTLLGWADHQWLWRGSPAHVRQRAEQIAAFYLGQQPDSLAWLLHHEVRYIVWNGIEPGATAAAFGHIAQQIGSRYHWQAFHVAGEQQVGLWIRRPAS